MIFLQKNLEIWGKTAFGSRDSSEKKNNAVLLEVNCLNEKTPETGLEHQFDAYCKKLLKTKPATATRKNSAGGMMKRPSPTFRSKNCPNFKKWTNILRIYITFL